jgi:hypothetical protein
MMKSGDEMAWEAHNIQLSIEPEPTESDTTFIDDDEKVFKTYKLDPLPPLKKKAQKICVRRFSSESCWP